MRPSGARRFLVHAVTLTALAASLGGCSYGFAGGGLPPHIRTVAVLPFENETAAAGLQRELWDLMRRDVENRLGLRAASETRADAVVRGRIVRYDPDIPVGYSADPSQARTARRRLQIAVDVEIVDQSTGKALWMRRGLVAEGEYAEQAELTGRRLAVEKIVSEVIAGAQSQW